MPFLDVVEYEMDMDEIGFQTQCSHKHETLVDPLGGATEDAVENQDAGDGEWNVEHPLQKQWKLTVAHLLQENAGEQGHQEHDEYHPDGCAVEGVLPADHLTHVDTYEEDGHTAPENL